jgi:ElaB/YqjD/DUF883 family membrane-anchored ribosome-binding protein
MSENPNSEYDFSANAAPVGETPAGETPGGDTTNTTNTTSQSTSTEASWQEVGRQFEALGQSLAQTVRAAWENEATQRQVQEMRTGLQSMVRDVEQAIQDSANSPKGQKIRSEAERAAESLKAATHQTAQEVRPHLVDALQQLNNELQRLIQRMENKE